MNFSARLRYMYILGSFICHGLHTSRTFSDVQACVAVDVFYRSAQHSHDIQRVPTQLHHLDGSMLSCVGVCCTGMGTLGRDCLCNMHILRAHVHQTCRHINHLVQIPQTVPISFCYLVQVATAEGLCTLDQVCPCNHIQLMLSRVGSHSTMMHTQVMVCKVYSGSTLTVYTYSTRVQ